VIPIKEETSKMAELLRKGYTMLNLSCPICKNPIFKSKKEEMFCPSCNREVVLVDNISNAKKEKNNLNKPENEKEGSKFRNNTITDFSLLEKIIINKIIWLTNLIKDENQLEIIEKQLDLIKKLLDILEKVAQFID
jgi:uncharacterized Zn finger protein (UPF0148 family)